MLAEETDISLTATNFGVSLRMLRFYEERGLITPIRRGSARFYTSTDRIRLQLIATGKRLGLSLSQLAELIDDRTKDKARTMADEPVAALPGSIIDLLSKDEIAQQLQMLERQMSDVGAAIAELRGSRSYAAED